MSSTIGHILRITTWGESHGEGLGVVVDGCPPAIALQQSDIQASLDRRRPGQSALTTPRAEKDQVEILSGVFDGQTLGTPISLMVRNLDVDSSKYEALKELYRPSHADFTYQMKYGIRDWRGGGRASARETVARVAAGAIAEKILVKLAGVEIVAWVDSVGSVRAEVDHTTLCREDVAQNDVRCPDASAAKQMTDCIRAAKRDGDSIGGCVGCVARNVPAGWGEPVFHKLTAQLAGAMMSIPASRGFEIGAGFSSTLMKGSEHNDPFEKKGDSIGTRTNHSGGIQGGISNGEAIWFRVAFKPVASIFHEQDTVNERGESVQLKLSGRHDPTVLPRAVPIVEAMCALVLADAALVHRAKHTLG